MTKTIYLLNQDSSLKETLVWTLQLGTDISVISINDPGELNQSKFIPDLILAQPCLYEKIKMPVNDARPLVLLIASHPDDENVIDALHAGAADVVDLGNGPEELLEKTFQLLNGNNSDNDLFKKMIQKISKRDADEKDYGLTAKEKQVLKMMREGNHLKKIAQNTNSSYETIRTHVKRIYKKLGVVSASEAVVKAIKMRI